MIGISPILYIFLVRTKVMLPIEDMMSPPRLNYCVMIQDFHSIRGGLIQSSNVAEQYCKLSQVEKAIQIRQWYARIKSAHVKYAQSNINHPKTSVVVTNDEDRADFSKVDLLFAAENARLVFHDSSEVIRSFYNAPKVKGLNISLDLWKYQKANWPHRPPAYSGPFESHDILSFEIDNVRHAAQFIEWVESGKGLESLKAYG